MTSFLRPSSSILIALNWRPSAKASVASTMPQLPGRQRAEVEVVRGRGREADQLAAVEDRDDEADVGLVRGAVVGVVVDDHVPRLPLAGRARRSGG